MRRRGLHVYLVMGVGASSRVVGTAHTYILGVVNVVVNIKYMNGLFITTIASTALSGLITIGLFEYQKNEKNELIKHLQHQIARENNATFNELSTYIRKQSRNIYAVLDPLHQKRDKAEEKAKQAEKDEEEAQREATKAIKKAARARAAVGFVK